MRKVITRTVSGRFARFVRPPKDVAYYLHLDNPQQIARLCNRFMGQGIVYGICNQVNQMIYIGSSLNPSLRFQMHLTPKSQLSPNQRDNSNTHLQMAISKYGLGRFKVLVFEVVDLPVDNTYMEKQERLRIAEQRYIDHFPKVQLYNKINSRASK